MNDLSSATIVASAVGALASAMLGLVAKHISDLTSSVREVSSRLSVLATKGEYLEGAVEDGKEAVASLSDRVLDIERRLPLDA